MGLIEDFEEALAEETEWAKPVDIIIDKARWELTIAFLTRDWRRAYNALEILNSRGKQIEQGARGS